MPLVFNGRVGNVSVNGNGGKRDLEWGPIPEVLAVKPYGNQQMRIKWTVRFCVPHCTGAPTSGRIMDLATECTYDLDQSGYTTRTFTATLRIPMTRRPAGDRTLPDSADKYLEDVIPAVVVGFRRIPPSRTISPDKAELRVTVRDEELPPNQLPEGIIEAEFSHTINNQAGKPAHWTGSVSATYEIARGSGRTGRDAVRYFFAVMEDRVTAQVRDLKRAGEKPSVIPIQFSMSEPNVYGKQTATLSQSYLIAGSLQAAIMKTSPLWRPVPGASWQKWILSLEGNVGPRGNAGLVFRPNDDAIVDLCGPGGPSVSSLSTLRTDTSGISRLVSDPFPLPTKENSWIYYENRLVWEADQGTAELRTLPKDNSPLLKPNGGTTRPGTRAGVASALAGAAGAAGFGIAAGALGQGGSGTSVGAALATLPSGKLDNLPTGTGSALSNLFGGPSGKLDNNRDGEVKVQRRVRPLVHIYMIGAAVRVGFPVPEPTLESVNGVKLTPANRPDRGEGFACGSVGGFNRPAFGAAWRLRYCAADYIPGPLPTLPNPFSGT